MKIRPLPQAPNPELSQTDENRNRLPPLKTGEPRMSCDGRLCPGVEAVNTRVIAETVLVEGLYSAMPNRSVVMPVLLVTHTSVKLISRSELLTAEGSRVTPEIQVAAYELVPDAPHAVVPSGSTSPCGVGRNCCGAWLLGRLSIALGGDGISL